MTEKKTGAWKRKFPRKRLQEGHVWIDGKLVRPRRMYLRSDTRHDKKARPLSTRGMCSWGFQFFSRVCLMISKVDITYLYKRPYSTGSS